MNTNAIMRNVVYALIPALIVKVYIWGLGNLFLLVASLLTMAVIEILTCWIRKKPLLSELKNFSGVITCFILVLTVPPSTPYYVGLICTICAILVGKQVFGGLGQNIFNPAMVGVCIFLVTYPQFGTYWSTNQVFDLNHVLHGLWGLDTQAQIDTYTSATPLTEIKTLLNRDVPDLLTKISNIITLDQNKLPWLMMSSAFLLGGLYLLARRIIGFTIPVVSLVAFTLTGLLHYVVTGNIAGLPTNSLVYGSMIFCAFFIATDPVTAPQYIWGKIIFAIVVGVLSYVIRAFTNFNDGIAFAIILGNALVPLLDQYCVPKEFGKV